MKLSNIVQFNALFVALFMLFTTSCTKKNSTPPPVFTDEVRVLAYSSMASEGGFLKSVQKKFQDQTKCDLKIESTLGAAQIVSYLKEHPGAIDFVVGIDQVLFERGKEFWNAADLQLNAKSIKWKKSLAEEVSSGFYPLDYGALTLIYNKAKMEELKLAIPQSAQDLLKPAYKKKFIVQDPRVSSPGMYFFTWLPSSVELTKLATQWLSLAQSWDSSYQMFMQGEAPMVWSYLSSIAYHESKGKGAEYGFVDFKGGLPLQVEGMAQVKSASITLSKSNCISEWFNFVYSADTQAKLAEKQWMLPVVEGVAVPAGFQKISEFNHFSKNKPNLKNVDALLSRFAKEVQGDHW